MITDKKITTDVRKMNDLIGNGWILKRADILPGPDSGMEVQTVHYTLEKYREPTDREKAFLWLNKLHLIGHKTQYADAEMDVREVMAACPVRLTLSSMDTDNYRDDYTEITIRLKCVI